MTDARETAHDGDDIVVPQAKLNMLLDHATKHVGLIGRMGATKETMRVLLEVADERRRQVKKWGLQTHPNGTGPEWTAVADTAKALVDKSAATGESTWERILSEEILEAYSEKDPEALRAELVQVAAVAVQWIEDIDRKAGK